MADLLAGLSGEFGPSRIARPYRDVRFRADKSPYKTEIYATFDRGGYVNFSADGLTAAHGYFMMTATQLERYRRAVDDDADGVRLAEIVGRLRTEGLEVGGGQALKTAPRGYSADHPRIELLRCKGLICWHHWPVEPWFATRQRPAARWQASCAPRRRCTNGSTAKSAPILPRRPRRGRGAVLEPW